MDNLEPEENISDSEIEITDLDALNRSGETPRRYSLDRPSFSSRTYAWRTLSIITAIVLLVVLILVSIPHSPQKTVSVTRTPLSPSAYSTVVLSITDGVAYAASKDGTVTAIRVSNGSLLWRHKLKEAVDVSAMVTNDGVMYVASITALQNTLSLTLNALHMHDGSLLWSHTFSINGPTLLPLTVIDQEIFVSTDIDSLAFRVRDGSLLWHNTTYAGLVKAPPVFNGVIYVCTQDGSVHALQASTGLTLWQYKAKLPLGSSLPVVVNDMIYLLLADGSIDAVSTNNGSLFWHNPALSLFAGATVLVADGAVYISTLDGTMYALRASDGLTLWHTSSHIPAVAPSLTVMNGVIYVGTQSGSVYALRVNNGGLLWLHTQQKVSYATTTVANGIVYFVSLMGDKDSVIALSINDGVARWSYEAPYTSSLNTGWFPIVVNNVFLLALQDGSIDALHTRNGSRLWHYATS